MILRIANYTFKEVSFPLYCYNPKRHLPLQNKSFLKYLTSHSTFKPNGQYMLLWEISQ